MIKTFCQSFQHRTKTTKHSHLSFFFLHILIYFCSRYSRSGFQGSLGKVCRHQRSVFGTLVTSVINFLYIYFRIMNALTSILSIATHFAAYLTYSQQIASHYSCLLDNSQKLHFTERKKKISNSKFCIDTVKAANGLPSVYETRNKIPCHSRKPPFCWCITSANPGSCECKQPPAN